MSNTRHSLSWKTTIFVLIQNGMLAALLFYVARDAMPLETSVIIALLIVSALVTMTLANRTLGALKTLSDDLSGLAQGRTISGEHLQRDDEIGTIARELERLSRDNLTRLVEDDEERDRRNKEESERHDRHARELNAAVDTAKAMTDVVETLDRAMRRLAAGDLRGRLDSAFPARFEGLRTDFNHAMASLQETLERIDGSARLLHSTCVDVKDDSASAMQSGLRQAGSLAKAMSEVSSLAETVRARKMQTEHTANVAYNARIDMRRPKDAVHEAGRATASMRDTSQKIEPVAATIREIAFEANMLAMNSGIEAAHAQTGSAGQTSCSVATDIRSLAERTAEAAKEMSLLSRQSAELSERAGQSITQAETELDAMSIYVDAVKEHLDTIAASSVAEIEKVTTVRLSILALAQNGRDQNVALESLAARTDRMMREVGAIDHHVGRFMPVTVLKQGGTAIPESVKPPKRGAHLRLVK